MDHRKEAREFLVSRRAKITPEQAGLPAGTNRRVPFFVFQGASDVVTLTSLAEEYFGEVEAPTKGLALIKDAGHFAAFTQPEPFLAELLTRVRPLASATSPSSTRRA